MADAGEEIKSSVSGEVINIQGDPYGNSPYRIVDVQTADGYIVRHLYVAPVIQIGKRVKAGETVIGKAQDIQKKFGEGMTNHIHVEIRDPEVTVYPERRGKWGKFKDISPEKAMMNKE